MCRCYTKAAVVRALACAALGAGIAAAQTPTAVRPDWRPIANTSVEVLLAAPAGGAVRAVWFSSDGSRLYATTAANKTFETADFESWSRSEATPPAAPAPLGALPRLPEPGVRLLSDPVAPGRIYALGSRLYRSEDRGLTWTDLTGHGEDSVIGRGIASLAVMPGDADQLVVGNDYGVWRSLDGGFSWSGLNEGLPNLAVRRIVRTPGETGPMQVVVDGFGIVEADAARAREWRPAIGADPEERERQAYSLALGATVTAAAGAGDTVYAGTGEGRLVVSRDHGRTWAPTPAPQGAAVTALWTDSREPRTALAAMRGKGPRILRTTNGGLFWDDLTNNLPEAAEVRAITADAAGNAIYVATDRGVFFTRGDLTNAGPATPWTAVGRNLPGAAAADVELGANGNQLYVALEGYGVFAARAPHRPEALRWVNAADFSSRAAAPGSLVSILGGRVDRAQAGNLSFPVLAASQAESQIQVPYEAAGPSVPLALEMASQSSTLTLPILDVSPAIFVDGSGVPMLLDGDSGLMLDAGNTARSGSRLQILATGLGRVRPAWPSGLPAPLENPPAVNARIRVFIDRAEAQVSRAVLAPGYIGFYLVEVQLPAIVNAGPAELYIVAEDRESNRVTVYLEP